MTSSGWVEVKDLIPSITKIGIYMNNCYPIKNNSFGTLSCILSEEQFINFFKEQNFKMKLIMKYVSELKIKNYYHYITIIIKLVFYPEYLVLSYQMVQLTVILETITNLQVVV